MLIFWFEQTKASCTQPKYFLVKINEIYFHYVQIKIPFLQALYNTNYNYPTLTECRRTLVESKIL